MDRAALAIPKLVSFAILPFSPLTSELANRAHAAGKEILLHLPMEAQGHNNLLGPGALDTEMPYAEYTAAIRRAIADVPHLTGVNNHMGSLLTQDPTRMRWLMETLDENGDLLYIDSRTTSHSAAGPAARNVGVPYLARDVFLDNVREFEYIDARVDELIETALRRGYALAIAHPHPETLEVLRARLGNLDRVRVVTLADLAQVRTCTALLKSSAAAESNHNRYDSESTE